jgi:hypothetical protein
MNLQNAHELESEDQRQRCSQNISAKKEFSDEEIYFIFRSSVALYER